jgi:hypothetical protein
MARERARAALCVGEGRARTDDHSMERRVLCPMRCREPTS